MIYFHLLRNQWKSVGRSWEGKRLWLVALGLIPVAAYFTLVLVGLGLYFDKIMHVSRHSTGAVQILHVHLLSVWFGMLGFRFFFQRPPRVELRPYLHLPIERTRLVRFFQASSLLSVHNLYPWLFIIPFWVRHVEPVTPNKANAFIWLLGMLLCLVASHYANTLIRFMIDRYARVLIGTAVAIVAFQMADQAMGWDFVPHASSAFFGALLAGHLEALALLAALCLFVLLGSSRALRMSLRRDRSGSTQQRVRLLPGLLTFGKSAVRNLIVLELMMMWRNKRTRHYVVISIGVSTAYTALLLSDFNAISGSMMAAAIGLFASGVFSLNYGQLMFAWESRYFDGLIAWDLAPEHMVMAKFMVLQGSCLVLFLVSLPLFLWLGPDLLMLHVAFLFYNAGVTSILMLTLAVFNRRRVNSTEGSFFNYQGFSILHWFWIIPTILPPTFFLYVLEGVPETALAAIAALGLGSMLLAWPSSMFLARILSRRKHLMAAGFRSYDR